METIRTIGSPVVTEVACEVQLTMREALQAAIDHLESAAQHADDILGPTMPQAPTEVPEASSGKLYAALCMARQAMDWAQHIDNSLALISERLGGSNVIQKS